MASRALMVCPEPPFPLRGGGAMRTAALLRYLSQRFKVDLVLFREAGQPDPRGAVPSELIGDSLLIELPRHSRSAPARVVRNALRFLRGAPPLCDRFSGFESTVSSWARGRKWHTAVVEHLWCATYAEALRPRCERLVLDLHNIESEWHYRLAGTEPFPLSVAHLRFAAEARRIEREWIEKFDRVLVTSAREQHAVPWADVYPNTIPGRNGGAPPPHKRRQIVFSGNMEYHPNKIAVKWFFEKVWPALRSRHDNVDWVLLGRSPDSVRPVVSGDPRVRLTGEVDDAMPEIGASLVSVVPLQTGSGTRIKILEAWAAGTPVVSTRLGAEGLPVEGVALADGPEKFAAEVSRLIGSEEERAVLSAVGTNLFNKTFTWEAGWNILSELGI